MKKINLSNKKSNSIVYIFTIILLFLFVTSQCFSQSKSPSKEEKLKSKQYMELMNGVFDFVQKNYVDEVEAEVLYKGALKGMLEALNDPYTLYLDTSTFRDLNDTTEGKFGGVGLSISKAFESTPDKPAYVEVASPIEGGPGYKAGIHAGDYLISINGIPTQDITMDEVLGMLRGKIGESVEVVVRRGKNMEFPVTLVRELMRELGLINVRSYSKYVYNKELSQYKDWQSLEKHLLKADWVPEFVAFAKEKGVEPNPEQLAKSKPLLVRLVNAYIVRNILNDEGFFPLFERDDEMTKKAVEVLRE